MPHHQQYHYIIEI